MEAPEPAGPSSSLAHVLDYTGHAYKRTSNERRCGGAWSPDSTEPITSEFAIRVTAAPVLRIRRRRRRPSRRVAPSRWVRTYTSPRPTSSAGPASSVSALSKPRRSPTRCSFLLPLLSPPPPTLLPPPCCLTSSASLLSPATRLPLASLPPACSAPRRCPLSSPPSPSAQALAYPEGGMTFVCLDAAHTHIPAFAWRPRHGVER